MPQFAVYRNPARTAETPFVLQVQTSRLDRSRTRVVMALTLVSPGTEPNHPMTPYLRVQGRTVFANPLNMVTVPAAVLGELLEILSDDDGDRVIRALDELVSRA